MKKRILLILLFLFIAFSNLIAATDSELKHHFLVLSNEDVKYSDQHEIATEKLVKHGSDAVDLALEFMDRDSPSIRKSIEIVTRGVGKDAVGALLYILASTDEDKAAFAANLLGEIGDSRAEVPLMLASKSSSYMVRSAAIGALGGCGDTAAISVLIEALGDTISEIRRNAATSLGKLGNERGLPQLIELLDDRDYGVRYAASYAIASIDGDKIIDTLIIRLESDSISQQEKYHIIETLGLTRNPRVSEYLLELLESPIYLERGYACQALGYLRGDYRVVNALKRCLDDASAFVRMMARNALKSIHG